MRAEWTLYCANYKSIFKADSLASVSYCSDLINIHKCGVKKKKKRICPQSGRLEFDPWVGKIPLEKGKATHSSVLAWRIPWTIQSIGSQTVGHDWVTFSSFFAVQKLLSLICLSLLLFLLPWETNLRKHQYNVWHDPIPLSVLLLLLLSLFSRVRLCATPETAAHQASPSLGFSRQEHWNGLPFLSVHSSLYRS